MPAMSTPLKALIQERLRAKIVRRGDEEYDYDVGMYSPTARAQPKLQGFTPHEGKNRSLAPSMPPNAVRSVGGPTSNTGIPLRLHTDIDPAAYVPRGHPLSARGYLDHRTFAPSPSYRYSHGHHHHGRHMSTHYRHDDEDYRNSHHTISRPQGNFNDMSPRWVGPPRDVVRIDSPPPVHHQPSSSLHRWEKSEPQVHHHTRECRRNEDIDLEGNNKSSHKPSLPESLHGFQNEHRRSHEADPRSASRRDDNQAWHDTRQSSKPASTAYHSKVDERHGSSHSTRDPEHVYPLDQPSSMARSPPYRTRHNNQHRQHYYGERSLDSSIPACKKSHEHRQPSESNQRADSQISNVPKPLDMNLVTSTSGKIRTLEHILSPDSRLAANVSKPTYSTNICTTYLSMWTLDECRLLSRSGKNDLGRAHHVQWQHSAGCALLTYVKNPE